MANVLYISTTYIVQICNNEEVAMDDAMVTGRMSAEKKAAGAKVLAMACLKFCIALFMVFVLLYV